MSHLCLHCIKRILLRLAGFWPEEKIRSPQGLLLDEVLPTIRHFENRRGEGPEVEVDRNQGKTFSTTHHS